MLTDFDVSASETCLLKVEASVRDAYSLRVGALDDPTSDVLLVDPSWYPLGARFIGDTSGACFWTHEGQISRCLSVGAPVELIYAQPGKRAAFCTSNRAGDMIAFSVRHERSGSPPQVSLLDLGERSLRAVPGEGSGDRFPRFSPSSRWVSMVRQLTGDARKLAWMAVYDVENRKVSALPKAADSRCVVSRCCWAMDSDSITYVEARGTSSTVKVCRFPGETARPVYTASGDIEALHWDKEHVVVLTAVGAELVAIADGRTVWRTTLPDAPLAHRADGFVAIVTHHHAFMLDTQGTLWRLSPGGELMAVVRSPREPLPIGTQQDLRVPGTSGHIPVSVVAPTSPNGRHLLWVVGGPGASAFDPDATAIGFLDRGYTLHRIAYQGCRENPGLDDALCSADVQDLIAVADHFRRQTGRPLPIVGISYGGLISMLAAARSTDSVACVVSLWGVSSLMRLPLQLPRILRDSMTRAERQDGLDRSSAVSASRRITAPLLMVHGGRDTVATSDEVRTICSNVCQNGGIARSVIYDDDTHGLRKHVEDYHRAVAAFLDGVSAKP